MNDADCDRIFALLSEYLDSELPPANCDDLEQHIAHCEPCVEFVNSLKKSVGLCREMGGTEELPPMDAEAEATLRRAWEEALERRRKV